MNLKLKKCLVKIINGPNSSDMTYLSDWYFNGRLADGYSWGDTIKPGEKREVLSHEVDWSWTGCSGYVTYRMCDTNITIAFSNPTFGTNKLGVGTGGRQVWWEMSSHNYSDFTFYKDAAKARMQFDCICTPGTTNTCTVNITAYRA